MLRRTRASVCSSVRLSARSVHQDASASRRGDAVRCLFFSRRRRLISGFVVAALLLALTVVAVAGTASTARAATAPGFTDSVAIAGPGGPTVMQFASDGSIVIADKNGQI